MTGVISGYCNYKSCENQLVRTYRVFLKNTVNETFNDQKKGVLNSWIQKDKIQFADDVDTVENLRVAFCAAFALWIIS